MRRFLKHCLIVLLIAAVPLGAYLWYSTWHGEHLAEEIVAQLDAEGPWPWDDLVAARPATAENQLAPELIDKVHGAVPAAWMRAKVLIDVSSERPEVLMTSEQATRLAEQLDKVKGAVAEGHGILKLPKGRMRLLRSDDDIF